MIIFSESRYPTNKNQEVIAAWLAALEKYPKPEGLFKVLVDTAVGSDKDGLKVFSAYLIAPGKFDEAAAYLRKFMTSFFNIEGFGYSFENWATIEEAMASIEEPVPER